MPRIAYVDFYDAAILTLKATACPVKQEIGRQIMRIGKPRARPARERRPGGYAKFTGGACVLTGIHWDGDADQLIKDLRKGKGDSGIATALWYWLHCHSNRKRFAEAIDEVAFGNRKQFDHDFILDPEDELSVILRRSIKPGDDVGPLVDINMLGQFLDTFLIEKQTDPCLLILLSQIEKLLETPTVLRGGKTFSLRSALGQTQWIDGGQIDTSHHDCSQWLYRGQAYMINHHGANYVIVKDDQTFVATGSLHQINSWLISIWQMLTSGTIPADKLDILLRYILVLCSYGRSGYLATYFNDDVAKHVVVFRAAAIRASSLNLDMRDYGVLDAPYNSVTPLTLGA